MLQIKFNRQYCFVDFQILSLTIHNTTRCVSFISTKRFELLLQLEISRKESKMYKFKMKHQRLHYD